MLAIGTFLSVIALTMMTTTQAPVSEAPAHAWRPPNSGVKLKQPATTTEPVVQAPVAQAPGMKAPVAKRKKVARDGRKVRAQQERAAERASSTAAGAEAMGSADPALNGTLETAPSSTAGATASSEVAAAGASGEGATATVSVEVATAGTSSTGATSGAGVLIANGPAGTSAASSQTPRGKAVTVPDGGEAATASAEVATSENSDSDSDSDSASCEVDVASPEVAAALRRRGRAQVFAGASLMGVGLAGLGVMFSGLYVQRYSARELAWGTNYPDELLAPLRAQHDRGETMLVAGAVTAAFGAVLGAALIASGARDLRAGRVQRYARVRVAPSFGGLVLSGRF